MPSLARLFPASGVALYPPCHLTTCRCLSHFASLQGTGTWQSKILNYSCFQHLQEIGSNELGLSAGKFLPISVVARATYIAWNCTCCGSLPISSSGVILISSGSGPPVNWQNRAVLSHMFSPCAHFLLCLSISFLLQAFSLQFIQAWNVSWDGTTFLGSSGYLLLHLRGISPVAGAILTTTCLAFVGKDGWWGRLVSVSWVGLISAEMFFLQKVDAKSFTTLQLKIWRLPFPPLHPCLLQGWHTEWAVGSVTSVAFF